MIVDQAEEDVEMVQDPFLEAGVSIPLDMRYQEAETPAENREKIQGSQLDLDKKEEKENNISPPTITIASDN